MIVTGVEAVCLGDFINCIMIVTGIEAECLGDCI
jgi:hypothetical protein